jgi:hypothetical protein
MSDYPFRLVKTVQGNGHYPSLYVVFKGEKVIGLLSKMENTKEATWPWKAYWIDEDNPQIADSHLLGIFYEESQFEGNPPKGVNLGGRDAALKMVVEHFEKNHQHKENSR